MRLWKRKSEPEEILDDLEEPELEEAEDLDQETEFEEYEEPEEPLPELQTPWRRVAVLIPCYNTGQVILNVVTDATEFAGLILCVNDGSTDDTLSWIRRSGAEHISFPKNKGKGHALTAGFKYLWQQPGWDVLITMDGDGQHLAIDIPYLIEAYEETGADIVVGARDFSAPEVPFLRRWSNRRSSKWIAKKSGLPLSDFQCGFRLFTREAIRYLLPRLSGGLFEMETVMLVLADRLGLQITEAPVTTVYTKTSSGRSSWRAFRDSRRIYRALRKVLEETDYLVAEAE